MYSNMKEKPKKKQQTMLTLQTNECKCNKLLDEHANILEWRQSCE